MVQKMSAYHRLAVAALVPTAFVLAGCGTAAPAAPVTTAPSPTTSSVPSSSPTPTPSTSSTAPPAMADGTNLKACEDGACEVEIKVGDVIRFGKQVKSTPPLTSLTVIAMSSDGPTLATSSGMTTTAYGGITFNNAVSFETVYADGTRAMVRISLVGA